MDTEKVKQPETTKTANGGKTAEEKNEQSESLGEGRRDTCDIISENTSEQESKVGQKPPTNSPMSTPPKSSNPNTPMSSKPPSPQSSETSSTTEGGMTTGRHKRSISGPVGPPKKILNRFGMTFQPGLKIEAMDFSKKWYPAKVVEVDQKDMTVLIHFDGWNQRYDEWLSMDSERIRPMARHSERKERTKRVSKITPKIQEHKVGDCVFARWTDCRLYPAKVLNIDPTGAFEVVFYDGFSKMVQPINIKHMPVELQQEYAPVLAQVATSSSAAKAMQRKMKAVSEKELLRMEQERNRLHKMTGKEKVPTHSNVRIAGRTRRGNDNGRSSGERRLSEDRKRKLFTTEEMQKAKKVTKKPDEEMIADTAAKSIPQADIKEEIKQEIKQEIKDEPLEPPLTPQTVPGAEQKITTPASMAKIDNDPHSEQVELLTSPVELKKCDDVFEPVFPEPVIDGSGTKDLKKKVRMRLSSGDIHRSGYVDPVLKAVANNEFKVDQDHNQYKCPFVNCNKGFRKETLLEYHIKYYHKEDGTPVEPAPPKKRRKTISVCSTDSDISVGGRSTSNHKSKKRDNSRSLSIVSTVSGTSESIPETPTSVRAQSLDEPQNMDMDDAQTTTTATDDTDRQDHLRDDLLDTTEDMDVLNKDEVVNCICQINEENGLMIQCDTCLCWQHALCLGITEDTLPNKYVCDICQNPPAVRESGQYLWNQEWWKEGTLACFRFLPNCDSDRQSPNVKATQELLSDMIAITNVLRSLKQQLHASKDKSHPELKRWAKHLVKPVQEMKEEDVKPETSNGKTVKTEDQLPMLKQEIKSEPIENTETKNESITPNDLSDKNIKEQDNINNSLQADDSVDSDQTESLDETEGREDDSDFPIRETSGPAPATEQPVKEETPDANIKTEASTTVPEVTGTVIDNNTEIKQEPGLQTELDVKKQPTEDSTEASSSTVNEDPLKMCEENLLEYITSTHDKLSDQMDMIEEQVSALESLDGHVDPENILSDVPQLKKSLHQLIFDLTKVKKMSMYH